MNEIENETLDKMVLGIRREADERIAQTLKQYEAGKRDCENGIYDKWYRYNSYQDGRAYDIGERGGAERDGEVSGAVRICPRVERLDKDNTEALGAALDSQRAALDSRQGRPRMAAGKTAEVAGLPCAG